MVYALVREVVGQLEASLSRRLQIGILKNRITKPKLDLSVSARTPIHRGPTLPPLIVTSRNTMKQTLRQACKAITEEAQSSVQKRTFLSPLFRSIGLDVSNNTLFPYSFLKDKVERMGTNKSMIKPTPGLPGYDGPSHS